MSSTLSPQDHLDQLLEGNRRFSSGAPIRPNDSSDRRADLVGGQSPFAAVVGCSDSRVPVELLFDQGFGDLFVVRCAGPVLDASIRASIEFAVLELGVAVVFVLGHESCGAVGATLRFLENGEPLPGELPALVEGVRAHLNPAAPHQDAYASHVRGTIADLLARSAAVRHARDEGDLVVTGGVYALRDGAVGLVDPMA